MDLYFGHDLLRRRFLALPVGDGARRSADHELAEPFRLREPGAALRAGGIDRSEYGQAHPGRHGGELARAARKRWTCVRALHELAGHGAWIRDAAGPVARGGSRLAAAAAGQRLEERAAGTLPPLAERDPRGLADVLGRRGREGGTAIGRGDRQAAVQSA